MKNEQLNFWTGEFAKGYVERNQADKQALSARLQLWSSILRTLSGQEIKSVLEVGSNIGLNLRAIKFLLPAEFYAIEPYKEALDVCISENIVEERNTHNDDAFNNKLFLDSSIDLVFTSGVLIHIHPNDLKKATDNVVRTAKKYVICVEYFSDKEEEIVYRGERNKLFKRDFGSFYLDNYPQLRLRDYGFAWKRATGLDNLTWWLFEKVNA